MNTLITTKQYNFDTITGKSKNFNYSDVELEELFCQNIENTTNLDKYLGCQLFCWVQQRISQPGWNNKWYDIIRLVTDIMADAMEKKSNGTKYKTRDNILKKVQIKIKNIQDAFDSITDEEFRYFTGGKELTINYINNHTEFRNCYNKFEEAREKRSLAKLTSNERRKKRIPILALKNEDKVTEMPGNKKRLSDLSEFLVDDDDDFNDKPKRQRLLTNRASVQSVQPSTIEHNSNLDTVVKRNFVIKYDEDDDTRNVDEINDTAAGDLSGIFSDGSSFEIADESNDIGQVIVPLEETISNYHEQCPYVTHVVPNDPKKLYYTKHKIIIESIVNKKDSSVVIVDSTSNISDSNHYQCPYETCLYVPADPKQLYSKKNKKKSILIDNDADASVIIVDSASSGDYSNLQVLNYLNIDKVEWADEKKIFSNRIPPPSSSSSSNKKAISLIENDEVGDSTEEVGTAVNIPSKCYEQFLFQESEPKSAPEPEFDSCVAKLLADIRKLIVQDEFYAYTLHANTLDTVLLSLIAKIQGGATEDNIIRYAVQHCKFRLFIAFSYSDDKVPGNGLCGITALFNAENISKNLNIEPNFADLNYLKKISSFHDDLIEQESFNPEDLKKVYSEKSTLRKKYMDANMSYLQDKNIPETIVNGEIVRRNFYPKVMWCAAHDLPNLNRNIRITVLVDNSCTLSGSLDLQLKTGRSYAEVMHTNILYTPFLNSFQELQIIVSSTPSFIIFQTVHFFNMKRTATPITYADNLWIIHKRWVDCVVKLVKYVFGHFKLHGNLARNIEFRLKIANILHRLHSTNL